MISKKSRPLIFFYAFLMTFMVLIFTLYSYFYAKNQKKWMLELINTTMFKVPIIIYVIVIALAVSGIVIGILFVSNRKIYSKIEEKLQLLANGHYEHELFTKASEIENNDIFISELEQDIFKIRNKMIILSKEVQESNNFPKILEGETKEEVIKEERHRIARELHDSVSQQLFAATMMLSALNEGVSELDVPEVVEKQIQMIANIINASQSEMRALLLHLRPINLEAKSLKQGIEMLLNELQTKINIELVWNVEDVCLQSSIEDNLFRIIQELLSNTLRHANAKSLEVYLKKIDETVLLRVVDDGEGFDMNNKKVGSYGLNNIRERVAGMGGTCRIVSFKMQGTSIEIKVPVLEESEKND
ncbi:MULTISPECIES: sensor histidine kinase [Vagococcus]|uniref:Sensor histidine kinase n=1 Tax=Vagococcus fluvialis bH819 TaxID=1255619 RepID=A0A1X6WNW8_9ENTE|nr:MULTISPECIES: sensor histidine kinase [Vagococcus]SLM85970.1 Sensor histidine kinase LiaS [Vagococcus fluvialis bH819]HCM88337.1 sensor histidine kinase [Vagococcus sp.]